MNSIVRGAADIGRPVRHAASFFFSEMVVDVCDTLRLYLEKPRYLRFFLMCPKIENTHIYRKLKSDCEKKRDESVVH